MKSAIVVGAGFAGLASALELARRGVDVTVLEASDRPGGRAQRLASPDGRFQFDSGPTLLVMTDVLRRALGADAFEALGLQRLEPGYRVLWPDGEHFDMHSDIALWLAEVGRYPGTSAARALDYLARVRSQFDESRARILEVDMGPAQLARLCLRPGKLRPWVFGDLRRFADRAFREPRVVDAMTFQPLYLGMSPRRSPALYALLPVEEILGGVWYARGGTGAIVDAFVALCHRHGVRFAFDTRVTRVDVVAGRARRVVAGSATFEADGVVVASDREPALVELLGRSQDRRRLRYGHSALVFYLGVRGGVDLPHHTVMLPDDPWQAYAQLDAGRVPDEPLLYACNPSATDPAFGEGSLSVLAPVPNRRLLANLDVEDLYRRVIRRLERHVGPLAARVAYRSHRGPLEFERDLGLAHGAAFGPDHGLLQMGALRPSIAYSAAENIVFAGSGTRPGSGVPMVLLSGRLAVERLCRAV